MFGPEDGSEALSTGQFFEHANAASRRCGVTRLAEITGLDRVGLPVWQAVRPLGRSLSVHQGKGSSPLNAKIGALCEAIESHCAELCPSDGPLCRWEDLPSRSRPTDIGDYCRDRTIVPDLDDPIQWCEADDMVTGRLRHVPHLAISLDYTTGLPSPFERTSGGLGAGPTKTASLLTSLLEVLERDAVGTWNRLEPQRRMATGVSPETVPYDWFRDWLERLELLGIDLDLFLFNAVIDVPVCICIIGGPEAFGRAYRRFYGSAAHGDPEIALFKALAEALQSRLTLIAGVRDDILPSYYSTAATESAVGARLTPENHWLPIEPALGGSEWMVGQLVNAGYSSIAVKRLDYGLGGVVVTKAFVDGLASLTRSRRTPR